ncbi:MAG TPA: hypothetical protein VF153_08510 [Candidatus Limnocylindria bacterium]
METKAAPAFRRGQALRGPGRRRIGTVDAVFADYLLVRTTGVLPVDLYVPRSEVSFDEGGAPTVGKAARDAYAAWHRPLKRAPHD